MGWKTLMSQWKSTTVITIPSVNFHFFSYCSIVRVLEDSAVKTKSGFSSSDRVKKPQLSTIPLIQVKPVKKWSIHYMFQAHSRASKILIRNQSLFMDPSQGQRAMLGGPEFVFWEILANGAGHKKDKKLESTP